MFGKLPIGPYTDKPLLPLYVPIKASWKCLFCFEVGISDKEEVNEDDSEVDKMFLFNLQCKGK